MKDLVINCNQVRGSSLSLTLRIQTRANGDVEIVDCDRTGDTLLGIIPKEKRAELAQFLVEAE